MEDVSTLLSDEFVEFSKEIAVIHEEKKQLEVEFKKYYDSYKTSKKDFENRVLGATTKFEEWKSSMQKESKK